MIVAFSTSSPVASVAVLSESGEVLRHASELAPRRASGACLGLLVALKVDLKEATAFLADIGPGSFTGVRVGVILAKTLGFSHSVPVGGATAFDLISVEETVVLPSKKGEFFVREPGSAPYRSVEVPAGAVGYGMEGGERVPDAARFGVLLNRIELVDAASFVPEYLIPPSISQPKKPYRGDVHA